MKHEESEIEPLDASEEVGSATETGPDPEIEPLDATEEMGPATETGPDPDIEPVDPSGGASDPGPVDASDDGSDIEALDGSDPGPVDASDDGSEPVEADDDHGSQDRSAPRGRSGRRRAAFAVVRAVVVLAIAAVGYQAVIPSVHVIRTRLTRLVISRPGVAAYNAVKPQSGAQNDSQTGLAAVTAAAKRSPNQTGVYTRGWSVSETSGVAVGAFLLPNDAAAIAALPQLRTQQLGPSSFSSDSLTRRSTYTVAGVPGSSGSIYTPSAKTATPMPGLVIVAFRYGRVVVEVEAVTSTDTQANADTLALAEYANLRHVEPSFSLTEVYRPAEATALWAAGAVALAAIVALGPLARRRRAQRRRQRLEEEMARRVVIGGQVITKHRR